jgi:hypothetical protein
MAETETVSAELARAQVWDMMLTKAREAQYADPKAAAAAKTLLADSAWKDVIEESVTAPTTSETAEQGPMEVPWEGVYPGYINGELAFGSGYADFDEAKTEKEGSFVIEKIGWGFATSN